MPPSPGRHHLTIRAGGVASKDDSFFRFGGGFVAGFPKSQPFLHREVRNRTHLDAPGFRCCVGRDGRRVATLHPMEGTGLQLAQVAERKRGQARTVLPQEFGRRRGAVRETRSERGGSLRCLPELRSRTSTHGRNMAGARALWRATGMTDDDFGKPIVAIANSYTQFVPGHVHLKYMGALVAEQVAAAGGIGREFHTIAVDDGIAMGHAGMLYSLPSREIIADSVEYMVSAHCADALVCISNCDKITPGMLNAAMRLNIPTVFVSGGPMEAGKALVLNGVAHAPSDLITAISASANDDVSDDDLGEIERSVCPTCGSCSGMFTANSMNCLTEALGLSLPGNGSVLATHVARKDLFEDPGRLVVDIATRYYRDDDESVLPRNVASKAAFENALALDVAMGGSTNTVLHILAAAQEAGLDFTIDDIDAVSRRVGCI